MEYGYQKVMEVQRRCGINFEDADKALKAEKGDTDKACVYAMRRKKKSEAMNKRITQISNIFLYRVIIEKDSKIKVDVSTGVIFVLTFFVWLFQGMIFLGVDGIISVFYLGAIALAIITGHTIIIAPKQNASDKKIEAVEKETETEEEIYAQNAEHDVESEGDGFNSIEIK